MPRILPSEIISKQDEPPDWLIDGMLYQGSLCVLAGDAGVGKSTLCYALAIRVATGAPFLGMPCKHSRVIYLDEENSHPDMSQYFRWAYHGMGKPDLAVLDEYLRWEHMTLLGSSSRWYEILGHMIIEHKPGLVIVDTANPAFRVAEEDDNSEAARIITSLRRLQGLISPIPSVLVLKHTLFSHHKGQDRTIRGAKGWLGAVDGVIYHVGIRGRPRADGLRYTVLEPSKTRAYGLRESIKIEPAWTPDRAGLVLARVPEFNSPLPKTFEKPGK